MNRLIVVALLAAAAPARVALADTFRCGNYIIAEGLTAAEIESRCGKPQHVERIEEPVLARRANGSTYRVGTAVHETWTYERESGQFPARIRIEDGKAKKIELVTRR